MAVVAALRSRGAVAAAAADVVDADDDGVVVAERPSALPEVEEDAVYC